MIGIISDIHGNCIALDSVIAELKNRGVHNIICLGDVGGYYCQINECCELLQAHNIFTLMGNHDWYLVTGNDCPRSVSANVCLNYQRTIIKEHHLEWLASLQFSSVIGDLSIVHGGWNDPMDEYVVPSNEYFSSITGVFFASGHTHIPCLWSDGRKFYCNPGSVGQPRDGDPRASFALWDGQCFSLHRVEYDIDTVQAKMKDCGFGDYYYKNLSIGKRIGAL